MATLAEKEVDEALTVALEFAEIKLSLPDMIDHIFLEAHRIQGSERARLLGGLAVEPHPDQIERIAKFLCVMKYLTNLYEKPGAASRHFDKTERDRRNGG